MLFSDFFDPYNPEHIEACKECFKTGTWPAGFIPENVTMGNIWQMEMLSAMANAWLKNGFDLWINDDDRIIGAFLNQGELE